MQQPAHTDLADLALRALNALRSTGTIGAPHAARLAAFLADWPPLAERRHVPAASLPVLRWLPELAARAPAHAPSLVRALVDRAGELAWQRSYAQPAVSPEFLDNYGWSEILGGIGPRVAARLACGFLILGPATHYPRHRHQAEELYLPLAGTAAWQQDDGPWRDHAPGTLIHHQPWEPHAMRTGAEPLLALYLWRGEGLARKATLDD
jgi:hypothetical protein